MNEFEVCNIGTGEKRMQTRLAGFSAIAGCLALCLAIPVRGQDSMKLTGVNGSYSPGYLCSQASGCSQDYTGIYYGSVDNASNTGIVSDDFNHVTNFGENWQATAISTSTLNAGNIGKTEFGSQIGLVGYAEIASLVSEIFTLNNGKGTFDGINNVTGTDLSEAIWDISTKGGISGISLKAFLLVEYVENLFHGPSATTNAQAYLNKLNLWILTPGNNSNGSPQEFWSQNGPNLNVPEGGAAITYLLLAALACFGAMRFTSRNQSARRETT
jgi:hypothetical protein